MLERDRRRRDRERYQQRQEHKAFMERSDKWKACPNHHRSISPRVESGVYKLYDTNAWFDIDLGLVLTLNDGRPNELYCDKCKSKWQTHSDFRHP